ncbi:site-specific DNA-methyltransferase [Klebsiella quasipneumoniae]|uniref:site-specific DNA-methyltransferase n=1 Tax=Klebsiella quasipneumoniae TaxID=1463165 RepID=UPI001FCA9FD2|nr:site-specific DNA-methyltransferase [Klebsiella quasipneumoniae]HCI4630078.1 site-specific DNA-methyltransferase [Klebsiella quasipneumoniae subsp. similipneumoniae]MCJ7353317.1 site-specific DNA-methyltransferase [Klebsiella quasipneumoniae]MEB6485493.1 site-specific DNA-methyltransferase [Klebsiella quasipneumoniae]HBV2379396.1 site-specific DNA-methyltransferase [Klebsiella quasipneumoniae]HCI6429977.1 site-specific DNA-methyltransferase [Klebsiella quasipneumoniae subsp. similipneumonia
MEKLKMHSPNITQDNIARIRDLFPGCVTEAKGEDGSVKLAVDFDQLRQELADSIVEGPQERYHLNWPGKREALLTANTPIAKTLRPCRDESVDFDSTKNLFIEGDNLDALKLLQDNYLGKIKMIYIDPPYNTGNDFIYEDDFSVTSSDFLKRSNQVDASGNRLVINAESNGRFHSDWLSMLYPRLKLARNFLRDDGVIFVSIDDVEFPNLRKILDEVFGESNFLATLVWDRNRKNDAKYFSVGHEYMVVYAKNEPLLSQNQIIFRGEKDGVEDVRSEFDRLKAIHGSDWAAVRQGLLEFYRSIPDDDSRAPLKRFTKVDGKGPYRDDGNINWPGGGGPTYEVMHPETKKPCKLPTSGWRYPNPTRFWEEVAKGRVVFGPDETTVPRVRTSLFENSDQVMTSVHYSYAQTSANEFNILFDGRRVFENPKPISDLRRLIAYVTGPDDLICDFFAGSATTAHAVMKLNAEDGGNRRHIMVQVAEAINEKHEAYLAGFKTIPELSRERIRRAGKKVLESACHENWNKDVGFRTLKIDTSNMADVYYTPDALHEANLDLFVENIKPDRTPEDLLFQVMLDWGVDLSLPINKKSIQGKDVFFVDGNVLAACFDASGGIDEAFVKELAKHQPLRVVFRDAGYKNSAVKINVEQIFKLVSPATEVKCI